MTAANCIFSDVDGSPIAFEDLSIGIGGISTDPKDYIEAFDVIDFRVPSDYNHSLWDQGIIPAGDIAILKLKGNSTNPTVMKLATSLSSLKTGTKITAAGWGTTQTNWGNSKSLLYTTLTVGTAAQCGKKLPNGLYCASK